MNTTKGHPIKNASGQAGVSSALAKDHSRSVINCSKPQPKWKRTLRGLLRKSHNRFSAESELHDHCLPSTVAELQARGLVVSRRWETVPGYQGSPVRVCRYWIAKMDREPANKLLKAA